MWFSVLPQLVRFASWRVGDARGGLNIRHLAFPGLELAVWARERGLLFLRLRGLLQAHTSHTLSFGNCWHSRIFFSVFFMAQYYNLYFLEAKSHAMSSLIKKLLLFCVHWPGLCVPLLTWEWLTSVCSFSREGEWINKENMGMGVKGREPETAVTKPVNRSARKHKPEVCSPYLMYPGFGKSTVNTAWL
jgi:hypothetical protein